MGNWKRNCKQKESVEDIFKEKIFWNIEGNNSRKDGLEVQRG